MAVLRTSKGLSNIVLVAFPGLGLVGTIAGRYIVDKLELPWTGYLFHEDLPPVGKVKGKKLLYPVNIYSDGNLAVVLSETTLPQEIVWDVSRTIVARAKKDGAKVILALSGVLLQGDRSAYGIPSGEKARRIMEQHSIKEIENGVITGISAAVLLHGREMGIPSILLLGPVTSQQDFYGAVTVVEAVSRIVGKDIGTEELIELAHQYEHELKLIQQRMEETSTPIYR